MISGIYVRAWLLAGALAASVALTGCMEQPSPVGANLLSDSEKVVVHTLSSAVASDSVLISYRPLSFHVSTAGSSATLFGLYGTIEARPLYKIALSVDSVLLQSTLKSFPLRSAYLELKLAPYRYGDTSTSVPFGATVHEVLTNFETGVTWDSVGAATNYGPTLGTFTGSVGRWDSLLRIPLDTSLVLRLLAYQRYDSLTAHFQGIILVPQSNVNGIISVQPGEARLHIVMQRDSTPDTIVATSVQSLYIANTSETDPPDRMIVQSGVAKRMYLMWNLPKLPKLSTVNSVTLSLTMDPALSRFGKNYLNDSLGGSSQDSIAMYLATGDSSLGADRVLGVRRKGTNVFDFIMLRDFIEIWKHGAANHGMTAVQNINGLSDGVSTVDRIVFYPSAYSDSMLRPQCKIVYSTIAR